MSKPAIKALLVATFPDDIAEHIVISYREVEENYRLEKWKTSELDAGHFVESVRRLIESQLFGSYTPFDTALGSFSPAVLAKYENATGLEELRLLIPRVLYAMYCIRNKRGVGHIAEISPNKLDATFIMHSSKWVLAELVRLASASSIEEARALVDVILERQVDLIWDDGETFVVLDRSLKTPAKILLVLYKEDRISIDTLRARVGYSNKTSFKRILDGLAADKHLALTDSGMCKLSPLGVKYAEQIIHKL